MSRRGGTWQCAAAGATSPGEPHLHPRLRSQPWSPAAGGRGMPAPLATPHNNRGLGPRHCQVHLACTAAWFTGGPPACCTCLHLPWWQRCLARVWRTNSHARGTPARVACCRIASAVVHSCRCCLLQHHHLAAATSTLKCWWGGAAPATAGGATSTIHMVRLEMAHTHPPGRQLRHALGGAGSCAAPSQQVIRNCAAAIS